MRRKFLPILAILLLLSHFSQAATPYRVPQDFPTVQAALNAAGGGDTILVSPGSHNGTFNINKPVTVASNFINTGNPADIIGTIRPFCVLSLDANCRSEIPKTWPAWLWRDLMIAIKNVPKASSYSSAEAPFLSTTSKLRRSRRASCRIYRRFKTRSTRSRRTSAPVPTSYISSKAHVRGRK
ncbi:MAG: hypothetical protein L6R28_00120 [Planctomycetes bacterium]|nr:hypothetical protein [Planctomycetota bacterium]